VVQRGVARPPFWAAPETLLDFFLASKFRTRRAENGNDDVCMMYVI
jgi:hypothetical protein